MATEKKQKSASSAARTPKKPVKSPEDAKRAKQAEASATRQASENARLKEEIRELKRNRKPEDTFSYNFMPYILAFVALFLGICFVIPGKMGILVYMTDFLTGILSFGAYFIPLCILAEAFFYKADARDCRLHVKVLLIIGFILSFSGLFQLIALLLGQTENTLVLADLYNNGKILTGGGVLGGWIINVLQRFIGFGAWILCVAALLLTGFAVCNVTPLDMAAIIRDRARTASYNAKTKHKERLIQETLHQEEEMRETDVPEPAKKRKAHLTGLEDTPDVSESKTENAPVPSFEETKDSEESASLPPLGISPEEVKQATDGLARSDAENADMPVAPDPNAFRRIKDAAHFVVSEASKAPEASDVPDAQPDEKNTTGSVKEIDLAKIFSEDAVIASAGREANPADVLPEGADTAEKTIAIESTNEYEGEKEDVKVASKPNYAETYRFPSLDFLAKDPNPATFAVTDELKQTSVKLVETLANFGVKTKIANICCGPTVTRYELQPEIGVRVKAIQNLSDDIALHLAAAGVRIEAPIPGKQAVGIEIPNKTVSIVYLRNLIENAKFAQLKSKLSVCLGMDVAGSPVYMDLAKMPHLLIAGATGMGKSVCINSFIVSILYKARPDECKLMLIDPKKVEFGVYNGMPHLLVPVVSDPKKAAGALSWAVNEMERRFQLIEEVGVRDLDSYNKITERDPEREPIPKIVIIIDELADLMMTARDSVENSICRIAQKARAAGMHLVIGTQRPSVDVITGLIKANVPSRIACTVASQVDSRTIIDISGAEKLLGRGDMLYAPVGCMKPMRVQGSFVTDGEIEAIIDFLKSSGNVEYDNDIISGIEREAERCIEKKRGKGEGGEGGDDYDGDDRDALLSSDEAVLPAIEIAVECGQISTSLLQRKLALGYSRAARIVDKLEKLGVVGPFEGSKPRKVLITREEYLEMKLNRDNG